MDVQVMKLSGSGNVVWNKYYGGNQKDVSKMIQPTFDGGYIVSAISRSFGWVNPDFWLLKLNVLGDTSWTRHYGSWDHEHCYATYQTNDGGFISVGHTHSYGPNIRIMFLKLDLNGGSTSVGPLAQSTPGWGSVYPNPTQGTLNVQFSAPVDRCEYALCNALGEVVRSGLMEEKMNTLDLSAEQPGIYFLCLKTGAGTLTRKVIIRR
jgi:hypothetical protein